MLDFFGILFLIGGLIIFFGVDQIFTVRWGEKWYPGLSISLWKIPDKTALKLILFGLGLILVTVLMRVVFTKVTNFI